MRRLLLLPMLLVMATVQRLNCSGDIAHFDGVSIPEHTSSSSFKCLFLSLRLLQ